MSDELIHLNNGKKALRAKYLPQELTEYEGNPFIEALPPILSYEQAYDLLGFSPPYNPSERNLSIQYRLHAIMKVRRIFEPLEKTLELERVISRIIRSTYINRNPIGKNHILALSNIYEGLINNSKDIKLNLDTRPTAMSISLLGYPGVGKTSTIERILSLYPQVIIHEEPIHTVQVVYMKLNCPYDGSLKTLCMNFFQELDELIGSDYYKKFGNRRNSISSMVIRMGQLSRIHGVSVLVVDEVQHLLSSKGEATEQMMNFFVTLVNEVGISVVTIGTMKAKALLQKDFRQARRSADLGNIVWHPMKKNDDWDVFVMGLWEYQWTKVNVELTQEFSDILYEESQGIQDIAVKIYMLAQTNAITSGYEAITPQLFTKVVRENLSMVSNMLRAIRDGDVKALERFEDIQPFDVEEHILQKIQDVDMKEVIRLKAQQKSKQEKRKTLSIQEKVIGALVNLEIDVSLAENAFQYVLNKEKGTKDLSVTEAMRLCLQHIDNLSSNLKRDSKQGSSNRKLQTIVIEGRKRKESAYDSLKKMGIIASPNKDFTL